MQQLEDVKKSIFVTTNAWQDKFYNYLGTLEFLAYLSHVKDLHFSTTTII